MPYGMCPLCGARSHYNLGSRKVWDEKYSDMQFAPELCFSCSGPLTRGDRVEFRRGVARHGQSLSGQVGVVGRVDAGEDGGLYWVRFADGSSDCFIRSELSPTGDPPSAPAPPQDAEPGAAPDPAT